MMGYFFEDIIKGVLVAVVGEADAAEELLHGLWHCDIIQFLVGLY